MFTTTRVERWVETGRDGAYWTDLMRAIHLATNELQEAGKVPVGQEPATDQLTIHPHDEHVIVRYQLDEPGSAPDVSELRDLIGQYKELLAYIELHIDWRYVTKKCTTEQKNLWADACDEVDEKLHPGDGRKVTRWWSDDYPEDQQ